MNSAPSWPLRHEGASEVLTDAKQPVAVGRLQYIAPPQATRGGYSIVPVPGLSMSDAKVLGDQAS